MNIGISVLFQASGGSLNNLVRLLLEWGASGALDEHRVVVFASARADAALRNELPSAVTAKIETVVDARADRGLPGRLWAEQISLPRGLKARAIDVLYCPANVVPYRSRVPSVVVLQNAAPFCDTVTLRALRGSRWWFRFQLLRLFILASTRKAARVVFVSHWFRELFVGRFALEPERAEVIPHAGMARIRAGRDAHFERAHAIGARYLLYVSHLNPYKNVLEVVEAFAMIAADPAAAGLQLVISGMTNFPWYRRAIEKRIAARGLEGRVILTGLVSQGQVHSLLAGAEAFVFASTCENCPTSLIEALSFGLPVASSGVGAMPEIAGDAVVYFDPNDPSSIAAVLRRVIGDADLRRTLGERALLRAGEFPTEADVARRTLETLVAVGRGSIA